MNIEEVKDKLLSKKAILIDVRELNEWVTNHIEGALHIPLSQLGPAAIPESLPRNKTIFIHCMRGARASKAASFLKLYYANVVPLEFTFEELLNANIQIPDSFL